MNTDDWPWLKGALILGTVFFIAVLLVKPIGVSTQFVITDGIIWSLFDDTLATKNESSKTGYASSNPYLNKSGGKYAKAVANPLNYGYVFVLAMVLGAYISARLRKNRYPVEQLQMPEVWRSVHGDSNTKRYIASFIGGWLVLFGARWAGGCTSGHMMSGIMQTALSGYVFATAAFASGIPLAIWLYRKT
jgi:hypothetical protein